MSSPIVRYPQSPTRIRSRRRAALSMLSASAAVLVLAACSAPQADATPAPSPSATTDAALTVRADIDANSVIEKFERDAADLGVAGAVLLLRTPEDEITATFGTTEFDGGRDVSLDDHIRIGSNTKTMTGTIIMQLVEEGLLDLEAPVSDYRPDVPGGDAITLRMVLDMRSGLYNYSESYELNRTLDEEPQKAWDPEDLLKIGLAYPPYFAPDQGYHYSNTNFVLLGLIAEQIEQKPLAQIMQERLFDPLDLRQTSFPASDDHLMPEPYSHGYAYMDNVFTLSSSVLPADLLARAQSGALRPGDTTLVNPSWAWAAGAAISTAGDLADWAEALVEGELLDEQTQQLRMSAFQPTIEGAAADPMTPQYGLAMAKLGPFYGHTGELPGYNSFMGHDPASGVTLVIWANVAPTAAGLDPATTMAKDLLPRLYG